MRLRTVTVVWCGVWWWCWQSPQRMPGGSGLTTFETGNGDRPTKAKHAWYSPDLKRRNARLNGRSSSPNERFLS